jgi:hypothetical protein
MAPSASSLDYGELELCYGPCPPAAGASPRQAPGFSLERDDKLAVIRHRTLSDNEPRNLTRDVDH